MTELHDPKKFSRHRQRSNLSSTILKSKTASQTVNSKNHINNAAQGTMITKGHKLSNTCMEILQLKRIIQEKTTDAKAGTVQKWARYSQTDRSICMYFFIDDKLLRINVVKVPFEAVTVQTFAKFDTVGNVASVLILYKNKDKDFQLRGNIWNKRYRSNSRDVATKLKQYEDDTYDASSAVSPERGCSTCNRCAALWAHNSDLETTPLAARATARTV